jgi:predicted DNA-binding protein (MmcQ/YjbR family)
MTPDEIAAHALGKPGAWPDTPWEDDTVARRAPGAK